MIGRRLYLRLWCGGSSLVFCECFFLHVLGVAWLCMWFFLCISQWPVAVVKLENGGAKRPAKKVEKNAQKPSQLPRQMQNKCQRRYQKGTKISINLQFQAVPRTSRSSNQWYKSQSNCQKKVGPHTLLNSRIIKRSSMRKQWQKYSSSQAEMHNRNYKPDT